MAIHEKYKNPEDAILKYRFGRDNIKIEIIDYVLFENGINAILAERTILEDFHKLRYKGPKIIIGGITEIIVEDIYEGIKQYF